MTDEFRMDGSPLGRNLKPLGLILLPDGARMGEVIRDGWTRGESRWGLVWKTDGVAMVTPPVYHYPSKATWSIKDYYQQQRLTFVEGVKEQTNEDSNILCNAYIMACSVFNLDF